MMKVYEANSAQHQTKHVNNAGGKLQFGNARKGGRGGKL